MLELESHGGSCGGDRKGDVRTDGKADCRILEALNNVHQFNELLVVYEWQKM